jgi:hypothetical protein
METSQNGKIANAPLWVKIFVPLHIIAITSWCMPETPREYKGSSPKVKLQIKTGSPGEFVSSLAEYLRTKLLIGNEVLLKDSPEKFYLLTTGFWQYWDMFAPNPSNVDVYADAMVYYKDGTTRPYQYPRIFTLSFGQKFLKERWRKFFERAGDSRYRYLWPAFGQRVALMCFDSPNNPPVRVELHRHEMVINPPGQPQNTAYSDELYYSWVVNQTQLRQDKGL